MGIMQLLNIFLFWIFFGFLAAHFAKKRGRSPLKWFFAGMFLGIMGLLVLFMIPKIVKKTRTPTPASLRPTFPKRSDAWLKMWYYLDRTHAQQGPFEFPDLIKKWRERGLSEQSFIWGEGMPEWKPLSELPDLIQEIEKAH